MDSGEARVVAPSLASTPAASLLSSGLFILSSSDF